MIIETVKQLDIKKVGDLNEGMTAGIDASSLPFVFELVSKQLYSNPIGSVIREITSNCFDSHIEAGVDDPVVISKSYTVEEGFAIEFKDVGVGLSTDRVAKIYMNYFSSTKRDSNLQIGGFGIGSKTPLAYTDMFYITTVYDGLEYEYIFHKGESKPTLESLLGYDEEFFSEDIFDEMGEFQGTREILKRTPIGTPTNKHNGTTIKIVLERGDEHNFKNELIEQLAYFDNVYFSNWAISNDYDIYEGEYFKFRSDIDQHRTDIHICIGKVRYPIDFDKVHVPDNFKNIPIAIKFEIGELNIVPSRENLRYSPESIKLIQQRINLAVEEIENLFNSQNSEVEDLKTYVEKQSETPKITFNEEKGHALYLWSKSGMPKNFRFKPLSGLPIKKTPKNLFCMWEVVGYISVEGKRHVYNSPQSLDTDDVLYKQLVIFTKNDRVSSYTDLYIKTILVKSCILIRRKELDYGKITKELGIKETKTLGKAKTIMEFIKVMSKIVTDKAYKYHDLKATDEWIAEYKRSVKESSLAYQRRVNKKVFVRKVSNYGSNGADMSIRELESRTGILVYGFKENASILSKIYSTVVTNKASIKNLSTHYRSKKKGYIDRQEKAFMVLQVSKSVEKDIIGAEKTIYWEDFLKTKFFRKIYSDYELAIELTAVNHSNFSHKMSFIRHFKEDHDKVKNSITNYVKGFNVSAEYTKDLDIIQDKFKALDEFKAKHSTSKIPLLSSVHTYLDKEDKIEVAEYLKYKGYKLRTEFYLKSKEQLKYEEGLKKILKTLKEPQIKLLTYTLNQTQNVNEENNTSSSDEESSTEESDYNDPF